MIVIKVGGSLFERPTLKRDLTSYLSAFPPERVILVAGGGHVAEAVRTYDRIHSLGEDISHHLAIASMAVTTELLRTLTDHRYPVLDAVSFCHSDRVLPHSWAVTSDSIAARFAVVSGASRLILLKSVDVPAGATWQDAVREKWVDDYFETIADAMTIPIEFITLPT